MKKNYWWVYLLKCKDGSLYCGMTNNLEKRILAHARGKGSRYVRSRLPFILEWCRGFETRSEALKEEYRIKQLKRSEKLALIYGDKR